MAINSSATTVTFRQYTYIDPYSGEQNVELKTNLVHLHAMHDVVEISIHGGGDEGSPDQLKCKIVPIPLQLPRECLGSIHSLLLGVKQVILSVQTSLLWLNVELHRSLMQADHLVHLIRCTCDAPFEKRGDSDRWITKSELVAIGKRVIENFVKSDQTEDMVHEVATLSGAEELTEQALDVLNPFSGIHNRDFAKYISLLEGRAAALHFAPHVNANTLNDFLMETSGHLQRGLRASSAPEARDELISLFRYYAAIVDQMVDQEMLIIKEDHFIELMEQIQLFKKDYGLGDKWFSHRIKRMFHHRVVTRDDDLLFLATYVQQGLVHLFISAGKWDTIKKKAPAIAEFTLSLGLTVGAAVATGGISLAKDATAYVKNLGDFISGTLSATSSGFATSSALLKTIAKDKGRHSWYLSFRVTKICLKELITQGRQGELKKLIESSMVQMPEGDLIHEGDAKDAVGSEGHSNYLFGIIEALTENFSFANQRVRRLSVDFLVWILAANEDKETHIITKRKKIFNKACFALQEISHQLHDDDPLFGFIDSTLGHTLLSSVTWKTIPDNVLDRAYITEALTDLKMALGQLKSEETLTESRKLYIKFWNKIEETRLSIEQIKIIDRAQTSCLASVDPDNQRILQLFSDMNGYAVAQFLLGILQSTNDDTIAEIAKELLIILYQNLYHGQSNFRFKYHRLLQDLWWNKEELRTFVAEMIGSIQTRWMTQLSIQTPASLKGAKDQLCSLQKILEEAPWLHSSNQIIVELYWHPVAKVYQNLKMIYLQKKDHGGKTETEESRAIIRQIFFGLLENSPNLPHPSIELSIQRFLLARRSLSDKEREKIDATTKPKTDRSPLLEQVLRSRYRYHIEATERWEKIQDEICFQGFPNLESMHDKGKTIDEAFESFMGSTKKSKQTVMLLKGAPGSGKTTVLSYLAHEAASGNLPYTPVFVSLAELRKPDGGLYKQVFEDALISDDEIADWKENRPFLFLFDGFDEMKNSFHIYHNNKMYQWKKSKFIFSCRSQLEGHTSIDTFFVPRTFMGREQTERFVAYQLSPFAEKQRDHYLHQFVISNHNREDLDDPAWVFIKKWGALSSADIEKKYHQLITAFESINHLSRNPFILRALIETLPDYFRGDKEHPITRTDIYDRFIETRLKGDTERVKKMISDPIDPKDLRRFSIVLSLYMLRANKGGIFDAAHDIRLKDYDPFTGPEAIGYLLPRLDEYRGFHQYASMIVPAGADRYRFMHNTIFEYFAACGFIDSLNKASSVVAHAHDIMHLPINYMAMLSSSEVIRFFREMIDHVELDDVNASEEEKTKWVQMLFSIVHVQQELLAEEETREQGLGIKNAVSNALTILNLLGVSFSGRDLSKLNAPGACLVNAELNGTNIKNSKLGQIDRGLTKWKLSQAGKLERITNIHPFYTEDGDQTWILVSGMISQVDDGEKIGENGIFYLYSLDKNGQTLSSKFRVGETGTDECTIVDPNNYVIDSEHRKLYFVGHNKNGDPEEIQVREFNGPKANYFANYTVKSKDDLSWHDGQLRLGNYMGGKIGKLPVVTEGDEQTAKAYSYDRKWLAIGKANGILEIWKVSAEDGTRIVLCIGKLLQTPITALTFMPDNRSILVGDNETKTIHHWDFQSLVDPTFNRLFEHIVDQVSLHKDGSLRLKTAVGKVFLWEIMQQHYVSPKEVKEMFAKNKFKEEGNKKRRVFGIDVKEIDARFKEMYDQQVTRYKKGLLEKIKQGPYKDHSLNLRNKRVKIELEAISKSIAVTTCDQVVMIMYGQGDWTQQATVHPSPVNDIIISDDEQTLITKSTDGTVVVWKLDKKAKQFSFLHKLLNTPFFINPELDK